MLKYMKENKRLFILYLILVPCTAICSAFFAMNLEPLLNVVYTQKYDEFIKYALLEVALAFMDMGAAYFHKICREKLRVYYVAGLKRDLFNSLFEKSITKFNSYSISQYTSIINRDVQKMNSCYFDSICGIYRVTVSFLISLLMVIYINPVVAIFNIAISFASLFIPRLFEKKMVKKQKISSDNSEEYYEGLKDYLNGFSTIKLFHIQTVIKEKMEEKNRKLEKSNYASIAINYTSTWVSMLCSQLSYVVTIAIGIFFALKGWMSVGGVVAVSQLIGGIVVPFEELPEYLSNYKSVKDIQKKIQGIITEKENCEFEKKNYEIKSYDFSAKDISFSYNQEENIIKKCTFQLNEGNKYILVGGSGSGKSTLAKLLMGFYQCNSGEISFGIKNQNDYSEKQFYGLVTYLEQDIFLFDDTLRNNITLYQDYTEEEIKRAIDLSGLKQLVEGLNNGIDTKIKENGQNFSGGEKQRIGIARALISGAKFLILDEVTASLDPVLASEIEDTIMNLQDTGVLLITHKWSEKLLKKSDGILMMKHGELVEQGTFEELMRNKKYFYSYYYNV